MRRSTLCVGTGRNYIIVECKTEIKRKREGTKAKGENQT